MSARSLLSSFVKSAYEEAARAKNQDGHEIVLRTVKELLNGKIEQTAEKI